MVKARINQFHGDGETAEHLCHGAMRLDIRTKLITAKEHVGSKQSVAFAFEIKIVGQPVHFVAVLFHPLSKERLLTSAFFVAKVTWNEFATNGQAGIGGENHVGQAGLRRNQMNLGMQFRKRRV